MGDARSQLGSRLFSRRTNGTVVGVALAAFDDRHAFAPTEHIWLSEKMDWVPIDDGLKQYPEQSPHNIRDGNPC